MVKGNAVADAARPTGGAGLGLRRSFLHEFNARAPEEVDFIEIAPENWLRVGGRWGAALAAAVERYPLFLHGLSLDIGGSRPIDMELVYGIAEFSRRHGAIVYSDHLTYCADDGHLYDLLPIPFTEESARRVAARVRQVQDAMEMRIALENASYYAAPGAEMDEATFIRLVLEEADCDLLLDVNNIWVNSINHGYDPHEFLAALPHERVRYAHIAGHAVEDADLRVDTHGADVIEPVWGLLESAYARCGPLPTLLERDFNIPPIDQLLMEISEIQLRLDAASALAVEGVRA